MGFHVAIDGKVQRGVLDCPTGRQVHLLPAYDTSVGMVPGQVQITAKSGEILAFAPLLDRWSSSWGSLHGVLFVAGVVQGPWGDPTLGTTSSGL